MAKSSFPEVREKAINLVKEAFTKGEGRFTETAKILDVGYSTAQRLAVLCGLREFARELRAKFGHQDPTEGGRRLRAVIDGQQS